MSAGGESWLICEECSQMLEFSHSPLKSVSRQIIKNNPWQVFPDGFRFRACRLHIEH